MDTYDGTDGVAEEIDDMPESLKEGMDEEDDFSVDGEDVSKAEQMVGGSDVIEPCSDVELVIKSVKVDKYVPDGEQEWKTARLELMLVVGNKGTDGKGKYKNKHFFPRVGFAVNRTGGYDFTVNAAGKATNYYDPSGGFFGDYNALLIGLGYKTNPAPKNDAAFRASLVGQTLLVDIKKDRKQVKDKSTNKYVRVDEMENVLVYKAKKASVATQQVEAAAS